MRPEELDRAGFDVAVGVYRNLLHHRTVYLEGIRRIAFRNMIHLREAEGACGPFSPSRNRDEWALRVQAKMLADQGLEDNALNQIVIGLATFYPVQIYLALLYAEIEYIGRYRKRSALLEDGEVFDYLDRERETVSRLKGFRTALLHPGKRDGDRLETDFLGQGESYDVAPQMQKVVDGYLKRLRERLSPLLNRMISELPPVQRLHCLMRGLRLNHNRMKRHRDPEGMAHTAAQMNRLAAEWVKMPEDPGLWSPNASEERTITRLSDHLNALNPSGPEQRYPTVATRQRPMDKAPLGPLFSGAGSPELYGDSRVARSAARSTEFIQRLLTAAAMLLHEAREHRAEFPAAENRSVLLLPPSVFAEGRRADFDELGLQDREVVVAPARIGAALLYEPLRLYSQMKRDDASVHDDALSAFLDGMDALKRFRNSVFHVQRASECPIRIDAAMMNPPLDIDGLYAALAAFFSSPPEDHVSLEEIEADFEAKRTANRQQGPDNKSV
ncbi:MAG: hypothetical protein OXJ56_05970 [Rhodospirillaceae bacterium]|nr:hypothetical protein [Rhodospirillaceae bacterium]MDE0362020.1 hypothetical protein [Rhodospirillaceae bacterium]